MQTKAACFLFALARHECPSHNSYRRAMKATTAAVTLNVSCLVSCRMQPHCPWPSSGRCSTGQTLMRRAQQSCSSWWTAWMCIISELTVIHHRSRGDGELSISWQSSCCCTARACRVLSKQQHPASKRPGDQHQAVAVPVAVAARVPPLLS